uniref:Uncharacterized protein n=1 Tax=Cacopsylla melanoneura TaxID=428564 RepID=A0A8D8RKN0_9HEMI
MGGVNVDVEGDGEVFIIGEQRRVGRVTISSMTRRRSQYFAMVLMHTPQLGQKPCFVRMSLISQLNLAPLPQLPLLQLEPGQVAGAIGGAVVVLMTERAVARDDGAFVEIRRPGRGYIVAAVAPSHRVGGFFGSEG